MNSTSVRQRYSSLSIALHWVMVVLMTAVYATILLRENYPRGTDIREGLKTWHFMLGLAVLTLVIIRLIARFASRAPAITPQPSAAQALLAKVTHLALYAFMIAMPIAGWMILSAEGKAIPFFGLELPALTGPNESLAEQVEELHELTGTVGYYLIGLHALAALFHHYVIKDNTLLRMMPGRR